ncbi:hypothetical protein ACLIIZ_17485 [Azonexus caeni]|uniref:hypothetical protein n=1 Tax=Azonexus caeni TaxID=266126 RepID=UPI003A89EC41
MDSQEQLAAMLFPLVRLLSFQTSKNCAALEVTQWCGFAAGLPAAAAPLSRAGVAGAPLALS